MPELKLVNVTKRFQNFVAVENLSLTVVDGEFVCLLGPSGCGKTTTLRIIGGFEEVESGHILLDGEDITWMPPQQRGLGFVFQQYALFPHLNVAENVGFGLRMRRRSRSEIQAAVDWALDLVRLRHLADRLPRQLSGGQQQRVALARALAIQPRLLLLDEPLSNLDAQLRDEMRDEIRRIQRDTGVTAIFVTHDQSEALALADRVAVMEKGRLLQMDDPVSIYEMPEAAFVGSFIGQVNKLTGTIIRAGKGHAELELPGGLVLRGHGRNLEARRNGVALIKQERIQISRNLSGEEGCRLDCRVQEVTYLGSVIGYRCESGGNVFDVMVPNHPSFERFQAGDEAKLGWAFENCRIFQNES